jgi:hypothetical protein
VVVTGTRAGRWLARVVACNLEVNADDPIVIGTAFGCTTPCGEIACRL